MLLYIIRHGKLASELKRFFSVFAPSEFFFTLANHEISVILNPIYEHLAKKVLLKE